VFNFDYGSFDFEKGNLELGVGLGWGVTADDDRGCYDPVWPRFDPVLVFFVEVKCVKVKFFEITYLYQQKLLL